MKYLIDLKNDLLAQFKPITADKTFLQLVNGNLPRPGDVLRTLVKNYRDGQKILICIVE